MKQNESPLKWRHYEPAIILLRVRWYCRYQLSYRDLEEMRASQCFKSFHTAERTLEGIEAMNMMRKGQVKRLDGRDAAGQTRFVASMFGVAAKMR